MAFITTTANSISSGGTISGDITIEGDLTVNGDGAGAYDEIVDGNLRISSTNKLEFGDTGTYIHQSADGVLDLVSDTEIEINATTIDMNGALDLSGNGTIGGSLGVGLAAPTDSIVKIQNDTSGDNALFINNRVADVGLYIQHDGTHSNPNGGLLKVYSNSAATGTRNLVEFVNDHASADACTVLKIQNDGDASALDVVGLATFSANVTVGGTLTVNGDLAEISGAHPTLKLTDSDDSNYAAIGYSDGALSIQTNGGDESGAADTIIFYNHGST